jgi:hypothetical protein
MYLQQFQFEIVHRPGKANANADALSRIPETTCFFIGDENKEGEEEYYEEILKIIDEYSEKNSENNNNNRNSMSNRWEKPPIVQKKKETASRYLQDHDSWGELNPENEPLWKQSGYWPGYEYWRTDPEIREEPEKELTNEPWWQEPLPVRRYNNYCYLKQLQRKYNYPEELYTAYLTNSIINQNIHIAELNL